MGATGKERCDDHGQIRPCGTCFREALDKLEGQGGGE